MYLDKQQPLNERILDIINQYGGIDGAHHKQWVLTQIAKMCFDVPVIQKEKLYNGTRWIYNDLGTNEEYERWVAPTDEYGAWDEGIAP